MAITRASGFPHYGSISANNGTNAITIVNAGDLMIAAAWIFPNTVSVTSVSSSKVTWAGTPAVTLNDATNGLWLGIWIGVSTATGSDTITYTTTGGTPSFAAFAADEFHDSVSASWSVTVGNSTDATTGTTLTFPSLTAADTGSMYWGFATVGSGSMTAGSTSGFTYAIQGTETATVFNPGLTNGVGVAPTMTVSTSTDWDTLGIVVSSLASVLTVSVADSTTTANTPTVTLPGGTITISVSDTVTTANTPTVAKPGTLVIRAADSTVTADTASVQPPTPLPPQPVVAATVNAGVNYVPQFSAPFRLLPDGTVATEEQDSLSEIGSAVYNIMVCPQGAAINDPDFGIPSPIFDLLDIDTTAIVAAVQALEPRATVEVVQQAITQVTHPQQVTLDVTAQVTADDASSSSALSSAPAPVPGGGSPGPLTPPIIT